MEYGSFFSNLSKIRTNMHISQEKLSLDCGFSRNEIGRIETRKVTPKIDCVIPICEHLGVTPDELFGVVDPVYPGLDPELKTSLMRLVGKFVDWSPEKQKRIAGLLDSLIDIQEIR